MSQIYTALPTQKQYGEFIVANFLSKVADDNLHLWFNIDPNGVGEIDVVAMHPKLGILFIEVKGHSLDQVFQYSPSQIEMQKSSKTHPAASVRRKAQIFANLIKDIHGSSPYINSTVWWPRISRRDWESKFSSSVTDRDTDAMLFAGEIDNWALTQQKFDRLWDFPLRGQPISQNHRRVTSESQMSHVQEILGTAQLVDRISPKLRNFISRPMIESTNFAKNYPFGPVYNVELSGPPGTGKTTMLREIGLLHAAAGGDVLYICYNKSLAAYMRREFKVLRSDTKVGSITALDLWDLYKRALPDIPMPSLMGARQFADEENRRLATVIQMPHDELIRYDTLLIDESQDLPSSALRFLRNLTVPSGSWFLSYGAGQEIYNFERTWESQPSEALVEWRTSPGYKNSSRKRPRSYRLSESSSLIARSFLDHFPSIDKASAALEKTLHRPTENGGIPTPQDVRNMSIDFGEEFPDYSDSTGEAFNVQALPVRQGIGNSNTLEVNHRALEETLINLIAHATDKDGHREVLILVKRSGDIYKSVIDALNRNSISFHDLVDNKQRRREPIEDEITISSHQNSRGLTGENVIVFDFEQITHQYAPLNNILHIALSRAWKNTIIFLDPRFQTDKSHDVYLEYVLGEINRHALKISKCLNSSTSVGQRVIHDKFGLGKITQVYEKQIVVDFGSLGTKLLEKTDSSLEVSKLS